MRPRLLKACKVVAVATGFLAPASMASANSVTLSFDSTTPSSPVSISTGSGSSLQSFSNITPGPYYWHEVNAPANSLFPNPTTTFCVELTQHISTGTSYTYTTTPIASTPGISAAQATAISELYAGHYSTTWESKSFAGSDQSTAFQLALWAIVYDTDGKYDLTTGNLKVTSVANNSTAASTAQSWLNSLASQPSLSSKFPNEQIVWLSNSNSQDQLVLIPCSPPGTPSPPPPPPPHGVPAPAGAVLAGIGFLGLLGRSRLVRKSAAV